MSMIQHFRVTRSHTAAQKKLGGNLNTLEITPTPAITPKKFTLPKSTTSTRKRKASPVAEDIKLTPPTKVFRTPTASGRKRRKFALSSQKKVPFGRATATSPEKVQQESRAFLEHEVGCVYKIIRKHTGSLGGNAAGGAIYGEITQKSFQRVVDYLKEHCEFGSESYFIDVGSGLGKPNFHVAVDPPVKVSYGVELEMLRWQLSLHNHKSIMLSETQKKKTNRCVFNVGDITAAKTFDPFTHVYSFDVGFPPDVMETMADNFNRSKANYLISFHQPRKIMEMYGFDVENIGRVATSMAGSSEGHTCYVYRRSTPVESDEAARRRDCDPMFEHAIDLLEQGNQAMLDWIIKVTGSVEDDSRSRRRARQTRARRKVLDNQLMMTSFCRTIPALSSYDDLNAKAA